MTGIAFLTDKLGANARLVVEAAFGADLTASSTTWTWADITSDVRQAGGQNISITQGRSDETSTAQAATCSFQLDNTSGNYSPYSPAGSHYPYIRRNTPIRVRVTLDGATYYTRFFGFANGFTPSWDKSAKLAVVSVSASGVLRRLSQGTPPKLSPLRRTISGAAPAAYWPVEDGAAAGQAASALAGHPALTVTGNVAFKPIAGFVGIDATAINWGSSALADLSQGGSLAASLPGAATTATAGQWTVHAWADVNVGTLSGDMTLLEWTCAGGTYVRWRLVLTVSGRTQVYGVTSSGSTVLLIDYGSTTTGFTSYAVTAKASGPSVAVTLWGGDDVAASTTVTATLAGVTSIAANTTSVTASVQLPCGHLTVFTTIRVPYIVSGESRDAYDQVVTFARDSWEGEIAFDRMARLCAEEGIPFAIVGVPPSVEDFEDSTLVYTITGTWARSNDQSRAGSWSLKSAPIGNSATTDAVVTVPSGAELMEVWYKVSSESGFDFFRVLLDGVQEFQASGEAGWYQHVVDVTGVSQVTFRYIKDNSATSGLDAAWIDDLKFMVNPSPVRLGSQGVDTTMSLLRDAEAADSGVLYDGFSAGIGYLTNSSRYNQSAALTVDASAGQLAEPPAPVDDDQRNRNLVKVDRKNGSSAVYEDSTGPLGTDAIGTYETSLTLNVVDDSGLLDRASWEVHKGTVEGLRYPTLGLDFAAAPTLATSWLSTSLNERIDVTNIVSKAVQHPPGTVSLLLEGYTETLAPYEWKARCNCSPYAPWRVFVLDTDRLDADASSVLAADITATATTFQVQTSGAPGAAWTTNSAEWTSPKTLYIEVGGEQMQVTNITGASSPQTFTVIRSVNGVTKAQKAGTHVGLWQPRVLAL